MARATCSRVRTAPRVAGAVAVFKHWYLYHYPELAGSPARLMSNILNFADGFALDSTGVQIDTPAPGWGLGRLKMRLFDDAYMDGTWYRATESVRLQQGEWASFLLGKADRGYLPRGTRRLRITIWWPEVNLGEGEARPEILACLQDDLVLHDFRSSTNGDPIRFEFDCADAYYSRPPTGDLYLVLYGVRVPSEVRGLLRDYRAVLVSWFWETGADQSTVQCDFLRAEIRC